MVPLAGLIDVAAEQARINKEVERIRGEIERIDKKLSNESFVAKAPSEVVEKERARAAEFQCHTWNLIRTDGAACLSSLRNFPEAGAMAPLPCLALPCLCLALPCLVAAMPCLNSMSDHVIVKPIGFTAQRNNASILSL